MDRHRNRLLVGVLFVSVLLLLLFVHATGVMHSGNTNMIVHEVMIILSTWMTIMTLVIVIQITVMTKRILRATELASRK